MRALIRPLVVLILVALSIQVRGADLPVSTTQIGYARLLPDAGAPSPAGIAIFGFRNSSGVLISEAGVPASALVQSGRIFVDVGGVVNTGIAIANPNAQDAVISYYFTDSTGKDFGSGSFRLPAKNQIAAFMTDAPFNGLRTMLGTFTFTSSSPVSAIALRGITNARGEFLMTTLPVCPVGAALGGEAVAFPHFADGGGWTTQIALVNPGDTPLSGSVQFLGQGTQNAAPKPVLISINGVTNSTFSYTIPARSSVRMTTDQATQNTQVGSITVVAAKKNAVPSGLAIFSFQNAGVTVSTATVPAMPTGNAFRIYVETSGVAGQVGSIQTGIAVSNPSKFNVTLQLSVTNLDGTPTGLAAMVVVPAGGQIAKFASELVNLPASFKGVLRFTASSQVSAISLRTRYNERGDLLVTTTPPWDDATAAGTAEMNFPHIVNGGGYSTQLVLLSPGKLATSGKVSLLAQDGTGLSTVQLTPLR